MGIMDQVGGALGGVLGQGGKAGANAALLQQVVSMLSKPGALNDLIGAFQKQGLGNVVQSWIGTGENLPISGDQLQKVLGPGVLAGLASKAGMGEADAAGKLSGLLPQVIDKLSPGGKTPASNDLGGMLSSVSKLLG